MAAIGRVEFLDQIAILPDEFGRDTVPQGSRNFLQTGVNLVGSKVLAFESVEVGISSVEAVWRMRGNTLSSSSTVCSTPLISMKRKLLAIAVSDACGSWSSMAPATFQGIEALLDPPVARDQMFYRPVHYGRRFLYLNLNHPIFVRSTKNISCISCQSSSAFMGRIRDCQSRSSGSSERIAEVLS